MEIRLKRYYGDAEVTKSVMEVWMDGETQPRMVCEAREVGFADYEASFPGASRVCLPRGRWRMKVGQSPYGAMGLRVARCPGHRQVYVGHRWARQMFEGAVLVGEVETLSPEDPLCPADISPMRGRPCGGGADGERLREMKERRIVNGDVVFEKLNGLVYEAWGRGEEFWMVVENGEMSGFA